MKVVALLTVVLAILTVAPVAAEPPIATRREAPFPAVVDPPGAPAAEGTVFHVLRGDFHIHTPHSDGRLSPAERVTEAWRYGYDVIAITDHGNFRAYEEALPHAEALGLILLRGIETGIAGQEHLVALDFSADYEPRNPHRWAEAEGQEAVYYRDQMRRLAEAGAYVLYAHPHVGLREPMRWAIGEGLLRGVEVKNDVVGNRWNTVESHGTWWYPFALEWALEHNLAVFANSDIHGARGDADQATTLVLAQERSVEGVRDAFEAGRTIAQFDGMLVAREDLLSLLVANLIDVCVKGDAEVGWRLRVENRGPVALEATLEDILEKALTLEPYQKVLLSLAEAPESIRIEWNNLWIRPTDNLKTTHPLTLLP